MNKKIILVAFGATAVICISILAYSYDNDSELNKAYGNVDIRQSTLSFERSGRIKEIMFDEGDKVSKGDVLASLDTQALDHQIAIQEAQCRIQKAGLDETTKGFRKEEIKQAKESVLSLSNSYKLAVLTNERYQKLYKAKSISAQDKDKAFYSMEQIGNQLKEAQAKYNMLQKGNRIEAIEKAKATYDSSILNLNYLTYQKNEQSVIKAPFDGVIRTRKSELGDMASPQSSVFELSITDKKRVRVYLTEKQLPIVKIGQKATVITTNNSEIFGKVAFISDTAMFTPKTVQTEALRAELVYEVRVDVLDSNNSLRLGQPVSVVFTNE